VQIRFGVELTYDRSWESDIRDHLARHAYDFTIGSVHDRVASPYNPRNVAGWVAGRSLREIVAPSFDEVEAAARSGLFDAIGHIDGVKRYLYPHVRPSDFEAAPELYERILLALVESGTALEVNTSGLRYTIKEAFPHPAIVARFRELGGRAVTVGSDAHRAEHANWGLEEGYGIAAAAGFDALTFRRAQATSRVTVPF
jgi:histidinol-phosphatase (PHP family)